MLCAVIMAGGKGTRFWPLSTEEKPKQFLSLLGEDTMLQMSVKRILPIIPMERIFIVTAKAYVELVKEQLPYLNEENIIVEPVGRNTAPCVGLSAFYINKRFKDATMVVLPSDHLIQNEKEFLKLLKLGESFVEKESSALVTIGITPTRAETGYGYIKTKANTCYNKNLEKVLCIPKDYQAAACDKIDDEEQVFQVERFVEKPNKQKAEEYLESGEYLWNSGMFIWRVENILQLIEKHLNNTHKILEDIISVPSQEYNEALEKNYEKVDNISIDFGIMEKADNIYVMPGDLGWDDVGSWKAIERYRERDKNNNIVFGEVTNLQGKNNIIVSQNKPIILSGVEDIVLVESEDMIFLGKKENIENLSKLRDELGPQAKTQ